MSNNISKVYLMNMPLDNDYKHTLYFNSKTEQEDYFRNLPSISFTDFSYQRKDAVMRIPLQYDEALKYNYVRYQNTAYSNKWFYAFITNYEYKGDDQTNITIETDVMQTWLFDYYVKPSFIEREHVNDDTIGKHTIPENLETGEYVNTFSEYIEELKDTSIVFSVTKKPVKQDDGTEDLENTTGTFYNGLYSGVNYFVIGREYSTKINAFIKKYDEGATENIKSIFVAPKFLTEQLTQDKEEVYELESSAMPYFNEYTVLKSNGDTDYIPKNNKLNCYPYKYLLLSNNNGGGAIYQYEHFEGSEMRFYYEGTICPGCSVRIYPMNYKNGEYDRTGGTPNREEGLSLGKYAICNWTSDEYTNWLTQNGVNIAIGITSGVGQIVGGIATTVGTSGVGSAIGVGMIASGVGTIAGQMGQIYQHSFIPPQARGNINSGDVVTGGQTNTFYFYHMTIKEEYQKIIDDYFSMFGYKTNCVKIPNKNHRQNYWFTKTVDVNISGNIPKEDLSKIKSCYNNGITFWKNKTNFKDYSIDNPII